MNPGSARVLNQSFCVDGFSKTYRHSTSSLDGLHHTSERYQLGRICVLFGAYHNVIISCYKLLITEYRLEMQNTLRCRINFKVKPLNVQYINCKRGEITLHVSAGLQRGYDKASFCNASLEIQVPQVVRNAVFSPTRLTQQRMNTTVFGTLRPWDNWATFLF